MDDHPQMSPASRQLLKRMEAGELAGWATPAVISEVVWVLSSVYRLSRAEVAGHVRLVLQFQGVALERRDVLERALELYESVNMDFVDAYHAALLESRGETALYSYDRDFDRVATLTRLEP